MLVSFFRFYALGLCIFAVSPIIAGGSIFHGADKMVHRRFTSLCLKYAGENNFVTRMPFSNRESFSTFDLSKCDFVEDDLSISIGVPTRRIFDLTFSGSTEIPAGNPYFGKVEFFIACQSHLLNSSYDINMQEDEIGIFLRWSEWEYGCFSFKKIPLIDLGGSNLDRLCQDSIFHKGDLPSHINKSAFMNIWEYRVERRAPTMKRFSFGRSFIYSPVNIPS